MKKIFAILLAVTLLLSLAACGSGETAPETTQPAPVETTIAPETTETTEAPEQTEAPAANDRDYSLTFNGVVLTPGTVYDASQLPEPNSVYQVPSCAIEGTDNVYSFDELDITAFNDGTQEIIYSIALFDPNLCTDEGLYLGDPVEQVIALYGENYTENGTAMVYTGRNTLLTIIVQNGFVVDIEFSWITE